MEKEQREMGGGSIQVLGFTKKKEKKCPRELLFSRRGFNRRALRSRESKGSENGLAYHQASSQL